MGLRLYCCDCFSAELSSIFVHCCVLQIYYANAKHNIPRTLGGKSEYKNLQLLHGHCHDEKTALDLEFIKERKVSKYYEDLAKELNRYDWYWKDDILYSSRTKHEMFIDTIGTLSSRVTENCHARFGGEGIGGNTILDSNDLEDMGGVK